MKKKDARKVSRNRHKQESRGKRIDARFDLYSKLVRKIGLRYPTETEFERLKKYTLSHLCQMCGGMVEPEDFRNEQFAAFTVGKIQTGSVSAAPFYFAHRRHFEKALNEPVENYAELQEEFERKILKIEFRRRGGYNFDRLAPAPSFRIKREEQNAPGETRQSGGEE